LLASKLSLVMSNKAEDGYNGARVVQQGVLNTVSLRLDVTIMSGVEDGMRLTYSADNGDGVQEDDRWKVSIGRREDSDMCLRNDTFVSRQHAYLIWEGGRWWLQDCDSTNGSYLEHDEADSKVKGTIPIGYGELFRIGHTWMRIDMTG
jgi:predicted component of type VI protein secretion system